jgi:elongation factor G
LAHSIKRIRTLALVGQSGAGKTTLAEALLAKAGAIPAPGSVERGTTVCDYTPLEKQLQHSLKLALASFEYQEHRIHLLDTPGYPDFLGQALPAFAAVETAAIVINAQNGIEMMTGRLLTWAAKRGLDRLIVINKIDAETVDLEPLLDQIQQAFGKECLPLNLPAGNRSKVSDCFFAPSGEADFSSVEEAHRKLVDQVVEVDEKLMEKYLEKGEVSPEELHEPLERALREGHLIPVVFTSAKTGAGIAELLDVIVQLLPNPTEGNPPSYVVTKAGNGQGTDLQPIPDPGKHALAHVFKIEIDPYIGRLAVFRSRPDICTCCAARRRSKCTKPFLATSAPSRKSTTSSSTISCTTPPKTRTCTPSRLTCRRRYSVSPCSRRSAATSRKCPMSCTRSSPRIPASGSSTTRRRTRR